MENLPAEVMVDILSRLPVKTIIHCKFLCKKWHNLVNNSYFINLHLSRSRAGFMVHHNANIPFDGTPGILKWVEIEDKLDHHCLLHHEPIIKFDLNGYLAAPIPFTQIIPIGSVNGLICISQCGVDVDNIYICNPITREYLTLPRQQNYRDGHGNIVYNFGVTSLTGEYKVLRIFQGDLAPYPYISSTGPSLFEAEVYTLGTSQWRSLGKVPYRFDGFGVPFLNGYFHWIVYDQDAPERIFTFDLDKEILQLFPSPPTESEAIEESWTFFQNLAVLRGCLCKCDTRDSELTIWVMKEYGIKKSWHKEVVINQAICTDLDWPISEPIILIEGSKDGSILMVHGGRVLAYCPQSKTIKDLESSGNWLIVLAHRPSFLKLQNLDS